MRKTRMLRRDFLAGSGSLMLAGLSHPRLAFGDSQYVPTKFIDIHCHVFNAKDIPVVDFIEKSFARDVFDNKKPKPYAPVVDRILKDVVSLLQRAVKDEEQYLDEIKANRRNLLRRKRDVNKVERAIVIEVFRQWHTNLKPLPPGSTLTIRILNSFLPHIALGFIRREMFRNV